MSRRKRKNKAAAEKPMGKPPTSVKPNVLKLNEDAVIKCSLKSPCKQPFEMAEES